MDEENRSGLMEELEVNDFLNFLLDKLDAKQYEFVNRHFLLVNLKKIV